MQPPKRTRKHALHPHSREAEAEEGDADMLYGDASMCVAPMSADINTHTHTHTHTHAGVHAMDTDSAITMPSPRESTPRGLPRAGSWALGSANKIAKRQRGSPGCARAPPPALRRCARC